MNTRLVVTVLALSALAILPAPAAARERLDTVELKNSGRAICEIVSLEFGVLTARTNGFGTVQIELDDIASLSSPQLFDVELDDGTRVSGSLDAGAAPAILVVTTSDEKRLEIPFARVYFIRQLGATFWQSRRGRLNVGLDYAHASDASDFSFDGEVALQGKRFTWTSSGTTSISDDSSRERREREEIYSQVEFALGPQFELIARGNFQRNDDLDLDSRVTGSGAFLWLPVRSRGRTLLLGAGVGQSAEHYSGNTDTQSITAALLYAGFEYHRFGLYGTTARLELVVLPMLTGPTRHRIEVRSNLLQKFTSHFNFTISPYYSFDSRPPRATSKSEDWGWLGSVGWIF